MTSPIEEKEDAKHVETEISLSPNSKTPKQRLIKKEPLQEPEEKLLDEHQPKKRAKTPREKITKIFRVSYSGESKDESKASFELSGKSCTELSKLIPRGSHGKKDLKRLPTPIGRELVKSEQLPESVIKELSEASIQELKRLNLEFFDSISAKQLLELDAKRCSIILSKVDVPVITELMKEKTRQTQSIFCELDMDTKKSWLHGLFLTFTKKENRKELKLYIKNYYGKMEKSSLVEIYESIGRRLNERCVFLSQLSFMEQCHMVEYSSFEEIDYLIKIQDDTQYYNGTIEEWKSETIFRTMKPELQDKYFYIAKNKELPDFVEQVKKFSNNKLDLALFHFWLKDIETLKKVVSSTKFLTCPEGHYRQYRPTKHIVWRCKQFNEFHWAKLLPKLEKQDIINLRSLGMLGSVNELLACSEMSFYDFAKLFNMSKVFPSAEIGLPNIGNFAATLKVKDSIIRELRESEKRQQKQIEMMANQISLLTYEVRRMNRKIMKGEFYELELETYPQKEKKQ